MLGAGSFLPAPSLEGVGVFGLEAFDSLFPLGDLVDKFVDWVLVLGLGGHVAPARPRDLVGAAVAVV